MQHSLRNRRLKSNSTISLPAQKASAEAALAQAQVELDKTLVRAGVAGTVQQFTLRPGDVVNTMICPGRHTRAHGAGKRHSDCGIRANRSAGYETGMIAEATCVGKPFTIIPLVVTEVQDVIAAGQLRPTDQLIDVQQMAQPGTLTVFLQPLY